MPLAPLNSLNFYESTYANPEPALVEFYSPRCSYCGKLAPVLEDIQAAYGSTKRLYQLNVDEERELARYYRIRSVPTTILLKRGSPAVTCLGCMAKEQILQMWDIANQAQPTPASPSA
ncbi:MAG: thioredoxin family protein [Oscillospiraceae bacterium]|jgi:thioredoxin-like negative regulator of GroEL|nr:thioredoxin family protein [Oscillospiraceae bacterium]